MNKISYQSELIISFSENLNNKDNIFYKKFKEINNNEFCVGKSLKYNIDNCIGFKRRPWKGLLDEDYLIEKEVFFKYNNFRMKIKNVKLFH